MSKKLRTVLTVLLCAVLVYSVARIVLIQREYRRSAAIYEESRLAHFRVEKAVPQGRLFAAFPVPGESAPPEETEEEPFPSAHADLEGLVKINPEVVGWLWVEGTEISYPLVQAGDNQKYLDTSYNLEHSSAGSIFMDFRNPSDFSGDNTVIYGHNMKNGSMFGSLKEFADPHYRAEHSFVYVFIPGGVLQYRIFAAYKTESTSRSYLRDFSDKWSFKEFLAYVAGETEPVSPPEAPTPLLTLSTCTAGRRTERFVLHAELVSVQVEALS